MLYIINYISAFSVKKGGREREREKWHKCKQST
ncbi:hypothetical protein CsSME_00048519 [Camellia sinensis var. sinensis]